MAPRVIVKGSTEGDRAGGVPARHDTDSLELVRVSLPRKRHSDSNAFLRLLDIWNRHLECRSRPRRKRRDYTRLRFANRLWKKEPRHGSISIQEVISILIELFSCSKLQS